MAERRANFNHFVGKIVVDPTQDTERNINVEQGLFIPTDPPGVYPVHNMAHYEGMILSVHFIGNDWSTMEGSAVMVAAWRCIRGVACPRGSDAAHHGV